MHAQTITYILKHKLAIPLQLSLHMFQLSYSITNKEQYLCNQSTEATYVLINSDVVVEKEISHKGIVNICSMLQLDTSWDQATLNSEKFKLSIM